MTAKVNCRHEGGEEDCPPVCIVMWGERYHTLEETADERS